MTGTDTGASRSAATGPERRDLIVLSPHLDDAALSVGGLIHQTRTRGERVVVATIFTADEPEEPRSKLGRDLHRWHGLDRGILETRRAEDFRACELLGAEALHLGLPDAVYRHDAETGEVFYDDLAALFGKPHARDARQLVPLLEKRLRALPEARRVIAPLGIGSHVDHLLVRQAAERVFTRPAELLFYEDYPYVQRWGALRLVLKPRRRWRPTTITLEESDLQARLAATAAYTSQIDMLFGTAARMSRKMRRYARRTGGERLWRPT